MGVGHLVHDVIIVVVADAREDRQRELGDVDRQVVVVVADQVHGPTAAAQDQDGVESIGLGRHRIEGRDDAGRGLRPLHDGLEKPRPETEAVLVAFQMTHEVAVAGRRGA